MVKMSDIAKAVGVSISTVSRVMNNSSAISSETRGKILEAAAQLGYHRRPEPLIPSKANNVAGVIVPDMMSDYYARFLHAVVEEFGRKNLSALISISHFNPEEAILAVKQMYCCKVKCLLIIIDDCEVVSEKLLTVVRDTHLPVMFITASYISDMDFDCLYVDEMRSSVMAVEHLLHRGYTD
ncbi:MAG: LacI family DNA-binding transcriptional regulator, partial [Merdibacter sp.]